jgi:phosphoglycolate phosphatase-like HAD superfamily hydrolase
MGSLFVWDFHGVLEKNNEFAVLEVLKKVLKEFKIKKKAAVEEVRMLYGKKWAEYFKFYAPDADEEAIHKMVLRAIKISLGEKIALKYIRQNDYAEEVLNKISEKGHTNLIMSNSSAEALDFFLSSVNLQSHFHHKFGADNHRQEYGENTKIKILKKFLKDKSFDKIIVIDDMEEGIEMGLGLNAVTYLFSKAKKTSKAHYVIGDLREVLKQA